MLLEILEPDLVLVRIVQPIDHPPLLLLGADMDQDLDDVHAVIDKQALELVDLAIGALPRGLVAQALDTLDQDAAVPGAVEDRPVAGGRQPVPEAPEMVPSPVHRTSGRQSARHASIWARGRRPGARSSHLCRRVPSRRYRSGHDPLPAGVWSAGRGDDAEGRRAPGRKVSSSIERSIISISSGSAACSSRPPASMVPAPEAEATRLGD